MFHSAYNRWWDGSNRNVNGVITIKTQIQLVEDELVFKVSTVGGQEGVTELVPGAPAVSFLWLTSAAGEPHTALWGCLQHDARHLVIV